MLYEVITVTVPSSGRGFGRGGPPADMSNRSAGRFRDGLDTDSNCNDFTTQPATTLSSAADAGATNIKVDSVEDFGVGQTIRIGGC